MLKSVYPIVRDRRGNAAIIFAAAILGVAILAGVTVDFSRSEMVRQKLQYAADAAALAGARNPELDDKGFKKVVSDFVKAHDLKDGSVVVNKVLPARSDESVRVEIDASVKSAMMKISGVDSLDVKVASEVVAMSNPIEIALVLDNTGSMKQEMKDLRAASQELVDIVSKKGKNKDAKFSLVPYVASVNIGAGAPMAWMDSEGNSKHHADLLVTRWLTKYNSCSWPGGGGGGGGSGPGSGGDDGAFIGASALRLVATTWLNAAFGAHAAALFADALIPGAPYTYKVVDGCYPANPNEISHFKLFDAIPNAEWKGCVEARPAPYDVDDTPPTASNPDTLWVPYFWADGADKTMPWAPKYDNDYLPDGPFIPDTELETNEWGRSYSVLKYNGTSATIDETAPDTLGPNKSCGDPILPLTDNYTTISQRITQMKHWNGGGTITPQGLVWGWRTLSPGAPFSEGEPYGDVRKVIVLMTDGENMMVKDGGGAFTSHYAAYGALSHNKRLPYNFDDARDYVDGRLALACENAKAAGVEIFIVTFGLKNTETRALYDACASRPTFVYHVNLANELSTAFQSIAKDVSELRIAK